MLLIPHRLSTYKEGERLFQNGNFREAIQKYKDAIRHHGSPSFVLEGRIGSAYHILGQYGLTVLHFSNAIRIKDTVIQRLNRAMTYADIEECGNAITGAKVVLAFEARYEKGYHTDVEANYVLADCYFRDEEYRLSLQHLEAAIAIAKEHRYSREEIAGMDEDREYIKSLLE